MQTQVTNKSEVTRKTAEPSLNILEVLMAERDKLWHQKLDLERKISTVDGAIKMLGGVVQPSNASVSVNRGVGAQAPAGAKKSPLRGRKGWKNVGTADGIMAALRDGKAHTADEIVNVVHKGFGSHIERDTIVAMLGHYTGKGRIIRTGKRGDRKYRLKAG